MRYQVTPLLLTVQQVLSTPGGGGVALTEVDVAGKGSGDDGVTVGGGGRGARRPGPTIRGDTLRYQVTPLLLTVQQVLSTPGGAPALYRWPNSASATSLFQSEVQTKVQMFLG